MHQDDERLLPTRHGGYRRGDDSARPLLGLPCNGYYGDIGYATLRIESDRAVATLVQKAFCPHYELAPGETRPAWEARCADNRGEHCTFVLA